MALRELLVEFGAKFPTGAFQAADAKIGSLKDKLQNLGTALAGAFVVKEVLGFTRELADQADALRDQSRMLGLSIEGLQGWQHAAALNGVKAESFNTAFTKLQKNLAEASDKGTGPAVDALEALGFKADELKGKLPPTEQVLERVAAGMAGIEDPARRTQVAMALFGKAGAQLLPLFAEGPEGIKKLREEMEALGGGITQEFADQADELNDGIERLNVAWLSMKVRIGSVLLPVIERVTVFFTKLVAAGVKLAKTTNIITAALTLMGGIAVAKAGSILSSWAPLILKMGILAVVLAVAALALDELITFFEGGDTVIGDFLESWFGPGTSEKVRKWFADVSAGFSGMLQDSRFHSEDFRKTWALTLDDVANDFGDTFLGRIAGGTLAAVVDAFFVAMNAIGGGWSQMLDTLIAVHESWQLGMAIVWDAATNAGAQAAAFVLDSWISAFNTIVGLVTAIPGGAAVLKSLGVGKIDLDFGAAADKKRASDVASHQARAEAIDQRFRGPNKVAAAHEAAAPGFHMTGQVGDGQGFAAPSVTNTFQIAPGTPVQQQRAVANAATRGTKAAFQQRGRARGKK